MSMIDHHPPTPASASTKKGKRVGVGKRRKFRLLRYFFLFLVCIILLPLLLIGGTLAYFLQQQPNELTQKPPHNVTQQVAVPVRKSYLTVPVRIRTDSLADRLRRELPAELEIKERITVKRLGNLYIDCDLYNKGFDLTADNDFLMTELSVRFNCKIVPARLRQLSTRVKGQLRLFVRGRAILNEDWKVETIVQTDFKWDKKPTVNILNRPVRIADKITKPLTKELLQIAKTSMEEFLAEQFNLRDELAAFWDEIQKPVRVVPDPSVWLWAVPGKIYFPPWRTDNNTFFMQPALETEIVVRLGGRPTLRHRDLPSLNTDPVPSDFFHFSVPLILDYEELEKTAMRYLRDDKILLPENPLYRYVTVNNVSVYPSADRLVLGVNIDLKGTLPFLDTRGDVYAFADITYDPASTNLTISRVDYARSLDHPMWSYVTWLIHKPLQDALTAGTRMQLRSQLDEAIASVNAVAQ